MPLDLYGNVFSQLPIYRWLQRRRCVRDWFCRFYSMVQRHGVSRKKIFHQLRMFHARCARAICRVNRYHSRIHHISTSDLLSRLAILSIDAYVSKRQLTWAGHVWRMGWDRIPRKMLTSWVRKPRPRGCPSFTYGRGLLKALRKIDLSKDNWTLVAMDRVAWRSQIMKFR